MSPHPPTADYAAQPIVTRNGSLIRPGAQVAPRPGLRVVTVAARNADDLAAAAADVDVLVSTVGVGTSRKSNNLIQDSIRAITTAAQRTGLKRVVIQSAFGTGDSYKKAPLLMRLGYKYGEDVFVDKQKGEEALFESDLDWTVVYPVVLSDDAPNGRYVATGLMELKRLRGLPRIPRGDVAAFLLEVATGDEWVGRVAVLHPPVTG